MGIFNGTEIEQGKELIALEGEEGTTMSSEVKVGKLKRTLIKVAVVAVIIIAIVCVIWIQASRIKTMNARIDELINKPAISEPVTPQISLEVISTEIKGIGELATVEYLYTNAAQFEDSEQINDWNIPLTKKTFIIKYDGIIKAGIDVNEITLEIDEINKVLTVNMPQAKILSHETDTESAELLYEKNGLFNPVSIEDKIEFDDELSEEMEERAIGNGILTKAQESAEEAILNIISAIPGIEEYTIVFEVK